MRVGGQSEVGRLLSVAVKPAGDAFGSAAAVDRQWRDLGYTAPPELAAATSEYRTFLALLETAGAGCFPPPAGRRCRSRPLCRPRRSHVGRPRVIPLKRGKAAAPPRARRSRS